METPDSILIDAESGMKKSEEHLRNELRGIRTGRATPALVEYVKVDYYGAPTDLKSLAAISVPEPGQILIKPFDSNATNEIKKAIENSSLGLAPVVDAGQVRLNIPALSGERRKQLIAHCKKTGEDSKVAIRNIRRDANKHADALGKGDKHLPEDEVSTLKDEIQELLKKYESSFDELVAKKSAEIQEV